MVEFIKKHWVAYLIALAVAVVLGAGAAIFVGVKGSTPAEVRAERISSEKENEDFNDELNKLESDGSVN